MADVSAKLFWRRATGAIASIACASLLAALAPLPVAAGAAVPIMSTAIEFYNNPLRHYFITADPVEATAIDAGSAGPGWTRTGGQFSVFSGDFPGQAPVCRFYGTPGSGPNSHFYTVDAAECAAVKSDPGWTYEGIAFHVGVPVNGFCPSGTYPVYRSYNNGFARNDSNHRFTVDQTAYIRMPRQGFTPEGTAMCAPVSDAEQEADIVRLLEQATLGPSEAAIAEVRTKGIPGWIDAQLALNSTRYTQYPAYDRPADDNECADDPTPPVSPQHYCHTYNIAPWPVGWEFFRQSRTAPDQLRLRMAHVWHQIFAVGDGGNGTYGYADFHQRLRDNVFGTFENLLMTYALSPMLGVYQNWIYNLPEHDGIRPNENFARELMQLFTVGVTALNDDGTPSLAANGDPLETYTQGDVATIARVLTGFGYPSSPGQPVAWPSKRYYFGDMVAFDQFHDVGAKRALGGSVDFASGGGAASELRTLVHALIDHPNTAPFISRQLIQKTVTSSPSPAYVARIAAVFRDNGKGVRGDLAAVTRAMLLDPEARGSRKIDPEYGRLREPALYWTAMIRALDIVTDGVVPYEDTSASGQTLFLPPSVFSYYPADGTLSSSTIPAPEFGIYGSTEFLNRMDYLVMLLYNADVAPFNQRYGPRPYVIDATGTRSPSLTIFLGDAIDASTLVARMDRLFLHGTMTADMYASIVNAVAQIPASDPLGRVRLALRLVLPSVEYQVQK